MGDFKARDIVVYFFKNTFSRPQAQLSRSTFALHYVWILECSVTENREICDVGGHFGGSGSGPECSQSVSGGARGALGRFLERNPAARHPMPIGLDVEPLHSEIADFGQN